MSHSTACSLHCSLCHLNFYTILNTLKLSVQAKKSSFTLCLNLYFSPCSHLYMISSSRSLKMWSAELTFLLYVCYLYQCAVWGQGTSDPGLRGHPGHTVRPLRQCQQQLCHLAAHLYHLPPRTTRPASEFPRGDRHLCHCYQQGRDATTHLLQGGQEPQLWYGKSVLFFFFQPTLWKWHSHDSKRNISM